MLIVGIGEYAITNEMNEIIVTHALGSCVALVIYCPITKHTALAHIALPYSHQRDQQDCFSNKPAYYADVIVPQLVEYFLKRGYCKKNQLQISLIGGAAALSKNDVFQVGKMNIVMVKSILRHYDMRPQQLDVGGNLSRTVYVSNGQVTVKCQNMIL